MKAKGTRNFLKTEKQADEVTTLAGFGFTMEQIANYIGCSKDSVLKHYKEEFAKGSLKTNRAVVGALFRSAMEGNVSAQIFWCKARLQWRETDKIEVTGKDIIPSTIEVKLVK